MADRDRVLVEGGGSTVSRFLAAGVLDRMHLTVAPVVLGADGRAGVGMPGPAPARRRGQAPVTRGAAGRGRVLRPQPEHTVALERLAARVDVT